MSSRAALRYAKAVLARAQEINEEEVVFGNLTSVVQTLEASGELKAFLNSPVIKADDKRSALKEIFKASSEIVLSLIDILVDKNRANLLGQVAQSYIDIYNKNQGVVVADVVTAVALDSKLENKILDKIKEITGSDKATLNHSINPDILGGFILTVGDKQYDASISSQLSTLKKQFSKRV